jgi:transcriptional adapter 2-alpha
MFMLKRPALPTGAPPTLSSAPTNHEIAGFMPGRLEFEHEVDNDAEAVVKDFDFGLVYKYGGDQQPQAKYTAPPDEGDDNEEEEDGDEEGGKVEAKTEEVKIKEELVENGEANGTKSHVPSTETPNKSTKSKGKQKADPVPEFEDEDELEVKLALLDIYFSKLDKREEAKELIFDRGLTEFKRVSVSFPEIS